MTLCAFNQIDPVAYVPHLLHDKDQAWPETNCYIDVWIELLHSLQLEPIACLSMIFANDFDGDQWTFYKPPHEDLFTLYGIDVQELNVWRGILENASTQLQRGRVVLTECDSFFLPDTSGTDYRINHVKTTIAIQEIDLANQRLGYFHNSAYHYLQGEDFTETFRIGKSLDPCFMPMFAEFVRLDHLQRKTSADLAGISFGLLQKHFLRRPSSNPVRAFQPVFLQELGRLKEEGMAAYHAYAFANLRQLGAGYSLGASYLRWLQQHGQGHFDVAANELNAISDTTKILLLKTARAVMGKKLVDLTPQLEQMAQQWDQGMVALAHAIETR